MTPHDPDGLPLVSVMIPVYNHRHFMRECLDSVLAQDYQHLEVVVADDASTDGTQEIAREYAARFPDRIKVLLGDRNVGVSRNCNIAWSACTGKYVALFAGDDVMLPGKLSRQVSHMERHPECHISYHNIEVFEESTGRVLSLYNHSGNRARQGTVEQLVRYGTFNGGCANMVRRAAAPAVGYCEDLVASDWLFYIDTLAAGGEIHYLDETLCRYRRHDSSVTAGTGASQVSRTRLQQMITLGIVDARYPQLARSTRLFRAHDLYYVGALAVLAGRGALARRHLADSLRLAWVSWKWVGWWFRSFFAPGAGTR